MLNDTLLNFKVWDLFYESDKVRSMLARKIQEESLRTYLFTYSKVYDSISTETLSQMFELEKSTVHAVVSKMIINEELMASLDEPTGCMVMHRTEPSRLQSLSLQLADKIGQLVDNNERLLEFRTGGGWQGGWKGKDGEKENKGSFGKDHHHHHRDDRGGRNDGMRFGDKGRDGKPHRYRSDGNQRSYGNRFGGDKKHNNKPNSSNWNSKQQSGRE